MYFKCFTSLLTFLIGPTGMSKTKCGASDLRPAACCEVSKGFLADNVTRTFDEGEILDSTPDDETTLWRV